MNLAGLDFKKGKGPDEIWMCCPFCESRGTTPDTRYRLGVNTGSGDAHCFNCHWKSTGNKTFELLNLGFSAFIPQDETPEKPESENKLPDKFHYLNLARPNEVSEGALNYLAKRNVSPEQIIQKRMGYVSAGFLSYRVIFPVWNEKRKFEGYVARDWTGKQTPPYRNSTGLDRTLYNAHLLPDLGDYHPLVICEGIFDALALERAGFTALASLGREFTESQAELVKRFKNICIMSDWDLDGVTSAVQTAGMLRKTGTRIYLARPAKGKKDAGDMSRESLCVAIRSAREYTPSVGKLFELEYQKEKAK